MKGLRTGWMGALLLALTLTATACASGASDDAVDTAQDTTSAATEQITEAAEPTEDMTEEMTEEPSEAMTEEMTEGAMGAMSATGPACDQLPEGDEDGSLSAMADQPAATAASTNPLLTTLVTAVGEAGLVDTLNSEGPFTIFAPTNDAFAEIPESDLNALLADQQALTDVLTYHVHAGEALASTDLAETDSLDMVNEGSITLAAAGETLSVNDQADVVCADIQVGNGVVHLIDAVLMPAS